MRLLVPYLVWTAVYLALLLTKAAMVKKERHVDWVAALLYGESAVHLYFVPTLFFLLVLASACAAVRSTAWQGWALFAIGAAYFIFGYFRSHQIEGRPGYFVGMAMYLVAAHCIVAVLKGATLPRKWAALGLGVWLLSIGLNICGIRLTLLNFPLLLPLGGIGFCFFALGDWVDLKAGRYAALLGASYGIYLSHVLFLEVIEFGISRVGDGHLHYSLAVKVGMTSVVFLAALVFTLLIRRFKYCSILLLGERPASTLRAASRPAHALNES